AKPRTTSSGIDAAGPILKLLRERSVCAPQYLSAGTRTSPIVSFSILNDIIWSKFKICKQKASKSCVNALYKVTHFSRDKSRLSQKAMRPKRKKPNPRVRLYKLSYYKLYYTFS